VLDHPDRTGPATLALPPAAPEPVRPGFPWIASIAPVVGAVAIWAITGSAFALLFAALGPLVAVATMLDARRHAARARDRALAVRREARGRLREEIERAHGVERDAAWRSTPSARSAAGRAVPAWHRPVPGTVTVGSATVASELRVEGVAADDDDAELLRDARGLDGAPVRVEVAAGIGFVGAPPIARAAARAAVVQCADATGPDRLAVRGPGLGWGWLEALPHRRCAAPGASLVVHEHPVPQGGGAATTATTATAVAAETAFVIAVAGRASALPPGLGAVVVIASPRSATLHRTGAAPLEIVPELVAEAEASAWAASLGVAARRAGLGAGPGELPDRVSVTDLPRGRPADPGDRSTLRVPVGLSEQGPLELDLAVGPHALVAGTTGSGKSEFLLAWLTSLATAYAPDRVAFLLVDFKGGAAFEPVSDLPHVTGIVTDLDEAEAGRAVASIRAELRRREQVLRVCGVRDLAALDEGVELPRLVVVIDEFQAMVERFPELGAVIADVAARGRSLGVHLVLASQRPNGVVREQVTANCGIRISLRVLHRADSVAIIGSDDAAAIPPGRPGRAVADPGDGRTVGFQSAFADPGALDRARRDHAGADRPRRPWLDPLPRTVTLDALGGVLTHGRPAGATGAGTVGAVGADERGGAVVLGVADDPDRQRRTAVEWWPEREGAIAVLGAPGSGRSGLIHALAEQFERRGRGAVARIGGSRSLVWDDLHRLADAVVTGTPRCAAVVLDDLDTMFAGWPDDYRIAALARVEELVRGARGAGLPVAISAARLTGLGAGLRDLLTATVLLRHATRTDLVHAGGAGELWAQDAPPGSGQWRGLRAQFLCANRPAPPHVVAPDPLDLAGHPLVAIAAVPPPADSGAIAAHAPGATVITLDSAPDAAARAAEALSSPDSAGAQRIVIGDAQAWASNWALANAARSRATLVVHGGAAEYRALARGTGLPPILDDPVGQCWIVPLGMPPSRRVWPHRPTTDSVRPSH
jgi:S-DNA-T family DNA segregation ATPase FtsK/SpoIIIE